MAAPPPPGYPAPPPPLDGGYASPYPPQPYPPQQGGAGPSSGQPYPPQPAASPMDPPVKPPPGGPPGGYPPQAGGPPGGYPPAGGPPGGYPPQAPAPAPYGDYYNAQPAQGVPLGAPGYGGGMAPMGVAGAPPPGEPERCACSVGWVLFAVGFIFPVTWIAAVFTPFCTKRLNDRRAAMASSVALLVYVVLIIVLSSTSSRWHSQRGSMTPGAANRPPPLRPAPVARSRRRPSAPAATIMGEGKGDAAWSPYPAVPGAAGSSGSGGAADAAAHPFGGAAQQHAPDAAHPYGGAVQQHAPDAAHPYGAAVQHHQQPAVLGTPVAPGGFPVAPGGAPPGALPALAVEVPHGGGCHGGRRKDGCDCTAGWWLFGLGWIFPPLWFVGALLPCCEPYKSSRNDRRAGIGSAVMAAVTVVVAVVVIVVPLVLMARLTSALGAAIAAGTANVTTTLTVGLPASPAPRAGLGPAGAPMYG
ncbi:hypothetical protein HT031_000019 [Scenedesmus sp. PABB004]|nr:hypothetical protein HT031_000019 [Scenedesmus sp. PABB004]